MKCTIKAESLATGKVATVTAEGPVPPSRGWLAWIKPAFWSTFVQANSTFPMDYFDIDFIGADGQQHRTHGWFNAETRLMTQAG